MATKGPPNIIVIDDEETVVPIAKGWEQAGLAKVKVFKPEEVTKQDIEFADLVLVDFQIGNWPESSVGELPIGQKPPNGLALTAVLRQHISDNKLLRQHISDNKHCSPTAFAILTAQIEQLAGPLPPEYRHHALARINNLEWVFEKSQRSAEISLEVQVSEIARAVRELPKEWLPDKDGDSMKQLLTLLGIDPETQDTATITDDVSRCLPPLHELSQWSHGLALLRWFLHRILPYPCFLFDVHYLAARLRVDIQSLQEALKPNQPLANALSPCKYTGILSGFLGDRWWRSKVELLLWEKTNGKSFELVAINTLISELAETSLLPSIPSNNPVVCLDENYQPMDEFASIETAIRIRPDDWPAFADQAWTTVSQAKEVQALKSVVIEDDKEKLN